MFQIFHNIDVAEFFGIVLKKFGFHYLHSITSSKDKSTNIMLSSNCTRIIERDNYYSLFVLFDVAVLFNCVALD